MINRIIDFCVANKFFVLALTAVGCIAGWWSMRHIPVDAIPDLSDTQVIVFSRWDKSPDLVEDQVTYPIVSALVGAPKVKAVRGFSDFGYSYVYVIFEDGTDIYWARSRTQEYLAAVLPRLPQGARTELGPDATPLGWVYQYALVDESGKHSLAELRSYQDWYLKYYLKSVPGVAEVAPVGGFGKQYQVNVDPNRLQAYGLSINKVVEAVRAGNYESSGRLIEFGGTEYSIRGRGYVKSVQDLEQIAVTTSETGTPIRLMDIGEVVLGPDLRRGVADLDGKGDVVSGIVVMRHGQNALDVIDRVKAKLKEIEPGLPAGVKVVPVYDRSDLIRGSIDNLDLDRDRGADHGLGRGLPVPLAHPECRHPRHHAAGRDSARLHPVPHDRAHGRHHVAQRDRHRDRRDGGRRHRGGGADPQEPGDLGARRPPGGLPGGDRARREAGGGPELLRAAGDRRLLSAGADPRRAGGAALQAARLHQEPRHDHRRRARDHARPGPAASLHPHAGLHVQPGVAPPRRQRGAGRPHPPGRVAPRQPGPDGALPAGGGLVAQAAVPRDRGLRRPHGRHRAGLLQARLRVHAAARGRLASSTCRRPCRGSPSPRRRSCCRSPTGSSAVSRRWSACSARPAGPRPRPTRRRFR